MTSLWLKKSHPNFFRIYIATLLFHIATGLTHLFAPLNYFTSSSLSLAFAIMPVRTWGVLFLTTGLLMAFGLKQESFLFSRWSLALGALLVMVRAVAVLATVFTGEIIGIGGIWVWFLIVALHLSQISEPPVNPVTQK